MATFSRHFVPFFWMLACACASFADMQPTPPPTLEIPVVARSSANFDVKAATDAWLATVPPDKKARSDC